jgi:hypothetical protein
VERQRVAVHHVDVGLQELAVPALLRALAAPHLLDLVPAERELQLAGVLQHEAGERHGQVEVQPQRVVAATTLFLQALEQVHLFRGLALAQKLVERLHRTRLERREAVQLEGGPDFVQDVLLDHPLGRQPLREAGNRHVVSP